MTEKLYRDDSYARTCGAVVTAVDDRGIQLDRTVFYPTGGGQPGDTGVLRAGDGTEIVIVDTRTDRETGEHLHMLSEGVASIPVGAAVTAGVDWERRLRLMRMHTSMHLLCSLIPQGVTGGAVGEAKSRLDFNLPEGGLDKEQLTDSLNRLISEDHEISTRWISDDDLAAQPELVRTMSVKPPTGAGKVRLVKIGEVDLQPCGGTH
ncbi:MAG: alanyl-tRNA editing protein, partial [Rhodospirillales bacterium]|nr:alanyl-tRNA editing protein [Rhodospirillales bacterium]